MTRRALLPAAASAAAGSALFAADAPKPVLIEFRRYQLRNSGDNQRTRTTDFLKQQTAAIVRAGAGPVGAFASSVAANTPFLLTVVSYSTPGAFEETNAKLAADAEYQKALDTFNTQPGLGYERME